MKSRVPDLWYSVSKVAFMLDFSDTTVRTWLREGRFFPPGPDGQPDKSTVMQVGNDIRISARGVRHFEESHQYAYDDGIKARNRAELMRKLEGAHG
jgi:hypothetical protein